MKKPRLILACLFCFMVQPAFAESFVVTGPVFLYHDQMSGEAICSWDASCGYKYAMTVEFDPDGVGDQQSFDLWGLPYERLVFEGNIESVETVLYDPDGSVVAKQLIESALANGNQTHADVSSDGSYYDFARWIMYRAEGAGTYHFSSLGFFLAPGTIDQYDNGYPQPPEEFETMGSAASVVTIDDGTGKFHYYYGHIESVSMAGSDPFADCRNNARNHGQMMKCVNQVTRGWRKSGKISAKERGMITAEMARSKK